MPWVRLANAAAGRTSIAGESTSPDERVVYDVRQFVAYFGIGFNDEDTRWRKNGWNDEHQPSVKKIAPCAHATRGCPFDLTNRRRVLGSLPLLGNRGRHPGRSVNRPKLERIYIHNYRCFEHFELRPGGRSLLLGYNGSGKSSLFDVLAALQDLIIWSKDTNEVFPRNTLALASGSLEQHFELDITSPWGVLLYKLHVLHESNLNTSKIVKEMVLVEDRPVYVYEQGRVHLYDAALVENSFTFTSRRSFLASLEPESAVSELHSLKRFLEGIWILRLNPTTMSGAALSDETFLARDASNFGVFCRDLLTDAPDTVERAKDMLSEVLDGFEALRTQQVGRSRVLVIRWRKPGKDTYEIDFDQLSDGQKVLVALYVILFGVAPRATMLCLDEPDNFVSIREIQPFLIELSNVCDDTGLLPLIISHSSEVIDFYGAKRAILFERPDGAPSRVGTLDADSPLKLSELMARGWHAAE